MKIKENLSRFSAHIVVPALLALSPLATSCVYDHYDTAGPDSATVGVELNIVTRAMTSDSQTYEAGTQWENYIDIEGGDYKIYFFTYDPATPDDATKNNTLIAEFIPQEMTAVEGATYTQYTLSGNVGEDIAAYSSFKVVVLANWGSYPTVTAGTTTIDDLCNAESGIFDAFVQDGTATLPSETLHIPFYGVHEYSGVTWRNGLSTILDGDITLLRAVARVEIVLNLDESDLDDLEGFDSVLLTRYNAQGYCAPTGVYVRTDYDSNYTDWDSDFSNTLHLPNNANDADTKAISLVRTSAADGTEVWVGYVPEYDNTSVSDIYSYIQVNYNNDTDNENTRIYFANYSNGIPSTTADYDIFRNYLYRFNVTVSGAYLRVVPQIWENAFDSVFQYN